MCGARFPSGELTASLHNRSVSLLQKFEVGAKSSVVCPWPISALDLGGHSPTQRFRPLPFQLELQSAIADTSAQQGLEGAAVVGPHGEEIQLAVLDTELLSQHVKTGITVCRQ